MCHDAHWAAGAAVQNLTRPFRRTAITSIYIDRLQPRMVPSGRTHVPAGESMQRRLRRNLALSAALLAPLAWAAPALAAVSPSPVPELSAAIAAARPGDRVQVPSGVYRTGTIHVGRSGITIA